MIAVLVALVLNLLQVANTEILVAVALVLVALLLVRDLRREAGDLRTELALGELRAEAERIRALLARPGIVLIGPRQLRAATGGNRAVYPAGARRYGMVQGLLGHVRPHAVFDAMPRPAIENPAVTSVQFLIDARERAKWAQHIVPKLAACTGSDKVCTPVWCAMDESVSFILAEIGDAGTEALSCWGEPFMSKATARDILRCIFRVEASSELIARFVDLERMYRAGGSTR